MTTKLPPRTTRYNGFEDQTVNFSDTWMLLHRWTDSYGFEIKEAGNHMSIEIGPETTRRLVANLTAALKLNGHWKEPKT